MERIQTDRTLRVLLITALALHQPATTAVIVVDGSCSLADAITAANTDTATGGCSAGSGADELRLTVDTTLTQPLPTITSKIAIRGFGRTVGRDTGAADFGILAVVGQTLGIRNATIRNGRATYGGGVSAQDYAHLVLDGVTLVDNQALEAGGAIHLTNGSTLDIFDSALVNNTAGDAGGAIRAIGVPYVGSDTAITIVRTTLSGNQAGDLGGAIYGGFTSQVNLVDSTLSGNSARLGGGLYSTWGGVGIVENSTISTNTATQAGGGIFNGLGYGDVTLLNSTVLRNTGGNLYAGFESGDFTVDRSIVAYPMLGSNCGGYAYFDSGATSFDDDGTCPGASPIVAGVDVDATLADNGGPTLTHALLSGSVAIDAAGACGPAGDQRGFARADGSCDSGSFERGAAPVSGRVAGVDAQSARCLNLNTGQVVAIGISGISRGGFDCEVGGLAVDPGDQVRLSVRGRATTGASGVVFGVDTLVLQCRNLTTGMSLQAPITTAAWDCVAQGLVVDPGDQVEQAVNAHVR